MCCNHLILTSLVFEYYDPKRYVCGQRKRTFLRRHPVYHAYMRFKNSDIARQFIKTVNKCQQTIRNSLIPNTSPISVNIPYVEAGP